MSEISTARPPRVRPFFRGVLSVAIVLLALYVVWNAWDYVEARRLDAAISDARARGLSSDSATPADVPLPQYADDVERFYQAAGDLTPSNRVSNEMYHALRGGAPLPAPRVAEARAILAESEPAFELTRRARSASIRPWRPHYGRSLSSLGNVWALLSFRTWFLADTRQIDEAAESLVDSFDVLRAGEGLEKGTSNDLWTNAAWALYGRAMELEVILNQGRPTPALLKRLEGVFNLDPSGELTVSQWKLRTAIEDLKTRRQLQAYLVTEVGWPQTELLTTLEPVGSPYLRHRLTRLIRDLTEVADATRKPWPDRLRRLEALARNEPPIVSRRAGIFLPGTFTLGLESAQLLAANVAQGRTARVALAVEEFRADTARPPASLSELVPKYLDAVPIDPFNGEPLRYRLDASTYTIYSVGLTGRYDGGDQGPAWRPGVVPSRFIARTRVRLRPSRSG